MPDLRRGHCATGKAGLPGDAWLGDDPEQRELALIACSWCPVMAECRQWAVSLPDSVHRGMGVLGGLGYTARVQAHRALVAARREAGQGTLGGWTPTRSGRPSPPRSAPPGSRAMPSRAMPSRPSREQS